MDQYFYAVNLHEGIRGPQTGGRKASIMANSTDTTPKKADAIAAKLGIGSIEYACRHKFYLPTEESNIVSPSICMGCALRQREKQLAKTELALRIPHASLLDASITMGVTTPARLADARRVWREYRIRRILSGNFRPRF